MEVDTNTLVLGVIIISLIAWIWLLPKTLDCQTKINEVVEQCNNKLYDTKLKFSPDTNENTENISGLSSNNSFYLTL